MSDSSEKSTDPRLANLRPWQPGQSGNPGGRKKKPITELYERILAKPEALTAIEDAVTKALAKGQMAMVLQLKEMAERVEGKVTQPHEGEFTIVSLAERMTKSRERANEQS